MAQKNTTLRGRIGETTYDLMPKGSVYNIYVDDSTTLADKLQEIIASLNGKVTPQQLEETMLENGIIKQEYLPEGYPYSKMEELLPETTLQGEGGDILLPKSIGLVSGMTCKVIWNGTAYTCVAMDFSLDDVTVGAIIGDTDMITTEAPTGKYPFVIIGIFPEYAEMVGAPGIAMALDGSVNPVVSIAGGVVNTIDPILLPDEAIGGAVIVTYAGDTQYANKTLEEIAKAVCSGKNVILRTKSLCDISLTNSTNLDLLAAGESPAIAGAIFSTMTGGTVYSYAVGMDGVINEQSENLLPHHCFTVSVNRVNGNEWSCTTPLEQIIPYTTANKQLRLCTGSEYFPLWSHTSSSGKLEFARYDGTTFEKFTLTQNGQAKYPPIVTHTTT